MINRFFFFSLSLSFVFGPLIFCEDVEFTKVTLTDKYYTEAVAYGDFNNDGNMDVTSGNYVWIGPEFTESYKVANFNEVTNIEGAWASVWQEFGYDINGDGWDDKVTINSAGNGRPIWYENPKNTNSTWRGHTVFGKLDGETPLFDDIDGDGKPEFIGAYNGVYGYCKADWDNPSDDWRFHRISEDGCWSTNTHGLGVGDVNNDGRNDLIVKEGWFEQPESLNSDPLWTFHSYRFISQTDCRTGGAQMYAYDVNGNGRNDVITSLNGHGWGMAWFENVDDGDGGITFEKHMIMGDDLETATYGAAFSQIHAVNLCDIDGDGLKDIIAGKRWMVHGSGRQDPDATGDPVVYWFQLHRTEEGEASYTPHLINNKSGVGVSILYADVNDDGFVDVMAGGKYGAYLHLQVPRESAADNRLIQNKKFSSITISKHALYPLVVQSFSPTGSMTTVDIFTTSGRNIRTLMSHPDNTGLNSLQWDGKNGDGTHVSSGLYILRARTGHYHISQMFVLE